MTDKHQPIEIVLKTDLSKRKNELILIDFQVFVFLEIVDMNEEPYIEVVSQSGSIVRYSSFCTVSFLKDHLPEFEYSQIVKNWNNDSRLVEAI